MKKPRVPIVARILGVNALLVFLPVAAFLSLDTYERSLLSALEDSLVQQGRFLAAWLGEGEITTSRAEAVLASLERRHTARLRILDAAGNLLADSSVLAGGARAEASGFEGGTGAYRDPGPVSDSRAAPDSASGAAPEEPAPRPESPSAESSWIYRLLSGPVRLWRRYLSPPSEPLASADFYAGKRNFLEGAEVRAALEGRYGAATRISAGGQVSVTLYSALPAADPAGRIRGAVLASQSTYRILAGLYRLRLDVGRIFLASLAAASTLSLLLWLTISRPLKRLGAQARAALSLRGLAEGHFGPVAVSDEIGDLAGALREFSARLGERLSWAEDFASDLSHEIRNPLASIRAAAELIPDAGAAELRDLAGRIARDADRAARIVGGLRELSRIEGGEDGAGPADVLAVARNCARYRETAGSESPAVSTEAAAEDPIITVEDEPDAGLPKARISPDRLALALGALLDNAVSFSPPGAEVLIRADRVREARGEMILLSVLDRGPGIPPEHRDRIFDRFFSYRPGSDPSHQGLGLALVRGIALRAGGRIEAADRPGGGSVFTLVLPSAPR